MVFRTDIFPFMFLFLAVSAFSFSPGLIVWAGLAISIGWMTSFLVLTKDVPGALEWTQMRGDLTGDEYLAVFLHPKFIATGSRFQEIGILIVTASMLAGVMYRARRTVRARLEAEEQREAVERVFGQYVPVEIADHALAALNAGREIRELTDAREFRGVRLAARIGIATGPVVAGSVGGAGRQTYTVHGDTVNLAARLEALNKELGTRLVVSQATRESIAERADLRPVAEVSIRGQSGTAQVFTLA